MTPIALPGAVGEVGDQLIRADRLRHMNLEAWPERADAVFFARVSRQRRLLS